MRISSTLLATTTLTLADTVAKGDNRVFRLMRQSNFGRFKLFTLAKDFDETTRYEVLSILDFYVKDGVGHSALDLASTIKDNDVRAGVNDDCTDEDVPQ